jgi:hypothetical protein
MAEKPNVPQNRPYTSPLDQERAASMADEGGASGAYEEAEDKDSPGAQASPLFEKGHGPKALTEQFSTLLPALGALALGLLTGEMARYRAKLRRARRRW